MTRFVLLDVCGTQTPRERRIPAGTISTRRNLTMLDLLFYVYILASKRNGTLYIGVTNDLERRTYEHKNNLVRGFTSRYSVHMLVYYEIYADAYTAIAREKSLKHWRRLWKLELIEKHNPNWIDLCGVDGSILPLPRE